MEGANAGLLDPFPLWALFPITVVIAIVSVDLGFRIARYRKQRTVDDPEALPAGMVGATLALLAFMLAFTFSLASTRFETRRQLVLTESNAIGTAYMRAGLLPDPPRTEARALLHEYVQVRIDATRPEKLAEALTKSEEIQKKLWLLAVALSEKERSAITSLFVQSINQLVELHSQRLAAGLRSRIPDAIWIVLYLLIILAMSAVGYQEGMASKRRSLAVAMLILGFSAVLVLIADLDRPGKGWLQVNQQSMMDLKRRIEDQ